MRFHGLLLLIPLALTPALPALLSAQDIQERRPLRPDASVEIRTVAHDVTVRGRDRDEARIAGNLGVERDRVRISGDERRLVIEVEPPRDGRGRTDAGPLEVSVPVGAALTVRTVNGDIQAEEIHGRIDAEAVSGHVRISGPSTEVRAASVSGNVELTGIGGSVRTKSVSGDITIAAGGEVDAADAESVSGSLHFRGVPGPDASLRFESHSGDAVLELPGEVDASFDLTSFSGGIRSDIGPEGNGRARRGPPERTFTTGEGGARISVRSFSGDVVIRTL